MAELTEEMIALIRKLVHEEMAKILADEKNKREWQPIKPWPPVERK